MFFNLFPFLLIDTKNVLRTLPSIKAGMSNTFTDVGHIKHHKQSRGPELEELIKLFPFHRIKFVRKQNTTISKKE